jgi:hypothetical protein
VPYAAVDSKPSQGFAGPEEYADLHLVRVQVASIHRESERNRPKRGPETVARYSPEHEKSIPNRLIRCRMVPHRAPDPSP